MKYLKDKDLSEETVQDVFVNISENIKKTIRNQIILSKHFIAKPFKKMNN